MIPIYSLVTRRDRPTTTGIVTRIVSPYLLLVSWKQPNGWRTTSLETLDELMLCDVDGLLAPTSTSKPLPLAA